MSYTLLRVVEAGVVLRAGHRARFLGESQEILAAFDRFCLDAPPGIYAVRALDGALVVTARDRSALTEGMPIGFVPSPFFGVGDFAKPAPPGPYDEVRVDGVCTFLTDDEGREVIEACRGIALVFRDGVFVRAATRFARVISVVEDFLLREGITAAPLDARMPECWAVANAVAGIVVVGSNQAQAARNAAQEWSARLLAQSTRREVSERFGR